MKIMNTVGSDGGFNYQKKFIDMTDEINYNTKTISSPETHVIPINGYLGYISILVSTREVVEYNASLFFDDFECFTWSTTGAYSTYTTVGCVPISMDYGTSSSGASTNYLRSSSCLCGYVFGSNNKYDVRLNKLLDKTTIKCDINQKQGFVEMLPFKVKNIRIVINKSVMQPSSTSSNLFRISELRYFVD